MSDQTKNLQLKTDATPRTFAAYHWEVKEAGRVDTHIDRVIRTQRGSAPVALLVNGNAHLSGPIVHALKLACQVEERLGIPASQLFYNVDLLALLSNKVKELRETPPEPPSALTLLRQAHLTKYD